MFATVNFIYPPETFFAKIKYNLLPPPIRVEKIEVPEGSPFLQVEVPVIRGKIYWSNVLANVGKAGKNLLLREDILPEKFAHLKRFESKNFHKILCVNSALKALSLIPPMRMPAEVAVIDLNGSCASHITPLPKYCRGIKIITARDGAYERFKAHAMEEYGCAVMTGDNISRAFESPVVIMPNGSQRAIAFSRNTLIFAPNPENIYSSKVLVPEGINLKSKYLNLVPKDIPPAYFAAALYEQSGVSELKNSLCCSFRQNNKLFSYKEVISMLDY